MRPMRPVLAIVETIELILAQQSASLRMPVWF